MNECLSRGIEDEHTNYGLELGLEGDDVWNCTTAAATAVDG